MKIAVIGAGIVGITSAHALARDGHEVWVFERHGTIAEEASFAPAGLLAPSLLHPLSHTGWPRGGHGRAAALHPAIGLARGWTLRDLRWLWGWRRPAPPAGFLERLGQLQQWVQYGVHCLQQTCIDEAIAFETAPGQLALFGTESAWQAFEPKLTALKDLGVPLRLLQDAEARAIEPGLSPALALHGAVQFAQDAVANCRQYAHLLKERTQALGVRYVFGQSLRAIRPGDTVQLRMAPSDEWLTFDRCVICAGSGSRAIEGVGSGRLPLTDVHSHSISVPVREPLSAPRGAVFDPASAFAIGRLGARVRVSGGAQLGAPTEALHHKTTQRLFTHLQQCFPGAADFHNGLQMWRGCSTFTPDGLALVGPSAAAGVWLNVGHGLHGWGLCSGTARLVADQIAGRSAALDDRALAPARLRV